MADTIEIFREDETTHGAYRADVPGSDRQARLAWAARDGTRIAQSTWVPPEARGTGIAAALVEALIADAREQGFRIDPRCSYVAAAFDRHPEWADLRADPTR